MKKYYLVKYAWDTGTDQGFDCDTLKEAKRYARQYLKDGWETVALINRHKMRIEAVYGEPCCVISWFRKEYADELRKNTIIPAIMWA